MEAIKTAVVTALTDIGSNMSGIVSDVTPIALGIVGAVMVVTFGVRTFRKLV